MKKIVLIIINEYNIFIRQKFTLGIFIYKVLVQIFLILIGHMF